MRSPTVHLDGRKITTWPAFHRESKAAFGFPDFYGNNLDAWIDCLSTLRDDDGMASVVLGADEVLRIELTEAGVLHNAAPNILEFLVSAIRDLNQRYLQAGEKAALQLVLL